MSGEILGIIGHTEGRGKGRIMRKYALVFSSESFIAAKLGGVLGTTLGYSFGITGLAIYNRSRNKKAEKLKDISADEILKADSDNFMIPYQDIVKVEMKKGGMLSPTKFTFFTKEKKYAFNLLDKKTFKECVDLIQSILQDRVIIK